MSYAPHSPHLASSGMPSPTLTNPDMILPYAEDNDDHHHQYHHRHHGAATAATALPSPPLKSFPYFASSQAVEASAAHLISHAAASSAEQQHQQHVLHSQRHSHGAALVHSTRTTTAPAQLHEQGLALLPAGNPTAIAPAGVSRQSVDLLPRDYPLKPTTAAAHSIHSITAPRRSTSLRLGPYGGGGGGGPDAPTTHTHFSRLFGGGPHKPLRHYLAAQDRFSMTILEGDEQVAAVAAIGPGHDHHDHHHHPSDSAALPEYADASSGGSGGVDGVGEKSRAENDLGLFDLSEGPEEPAIDVEEDEQSSAALSRRADWILAAAKRKLDALEGNLSRARHSIRMSPSPPPSSSRSSSAAAVLPIPARAANAERSLAGSSGTTEADKHARLLSTPVGRIVAGHARGVSDTTKAYTTSYGPHAAAARDARSARAQAAYGQRFRAASAAQTRPESAPANERSSSSVATTTMRDVPAAPKAAAPVGQRNYLSSFSTPNRLALERFLAPRGPIKLSDDDDDDVAFGANEPASAAELSSSSSSLGWQQDPRGLSRSRSVVPIREVRDQMEDLKGRISSLQQRAKQDHLKRRSLQNLRSGSPAADAEQWYLSAGNYANGGLSTSAGVGKTERPVPSSAGSEAAAESDASSLREDRPSESSNNVRNLPSGGDASADPAEADSEVAVVKDSHAASEPTSDAEDQLGGADQDDDDDFASAADQFEVKEEEEEEGEEGEIEYPLAVSERHEDRADAFDYEHFFLHSGMGHYSSTHLGRRNSYSSDDSIETTKPMDTIADDSPKRSTSRGAGVTADTTERSSHRSGGDAVDVDDGDDPTLQGRVMERNYSVVSISSTTSFATATEGNDDDYDYSDRLGFISPTTHHWTPAAAAATTTTTPAVAPIAIPSTTPRSGEHPVLVFGPGGGLVAAQPPPSQTLRPASSSARSDDDGSHTPTQTDHLHSVGGGPDKGSGPRGRTTPQQQHPLDEFFLFDTPADGLARRFSSASLVLSRRQRHRQRQQQQRPQRLRSPPPPPPMPLLPPPPPPPPPPPLHPPPQPSSSSSLSPTAPTPTLRTSSLPSTIAAASQSLPDDGSRALWALLATGTTAGSVGGGGGGGDSRHLAPEDEALLAPIVSGLQRLCAQLLRSSSGASDGAGSDDVSAARATLERVRTALLLEPNETRVR